MADLKDLQERFEALEGNITRLAAVRTELESLDTTGLTPAVQSLQAFLSNPVTVDEAEQQLIKLKETIVQRDESKRSFEEGVSLGQIGAARLQEGNYEEALTSLRNSLDRFKQSRESLATSDLRLNEAITTNETAASTNLLKARLNQAMIGAQEGFSLYEKGDFDEARDKFEKPHNEVEEIVQDANSDGHDEVEEEATRNLADLAQSISTCEIGKDSRRVEELVSLGNSHWENAEKATNDQEILKARDLLAEALSGLTEAFDIATNRNFQDTLPKVNQIRQLVQNRLDEVYQALAQGLSVVPSRPSPIPTMSPSVPVIPVPGAPGLSPGSSGTWQDRYDRVKAIGQGGSADVYLVRRKEDGSQFALKVPRGAAEGAQTMNQNLLAEFRQEAANWKLLKHGHIVELYEFGDHPYPWLLMEYMAGGSLADLLNEKENLLPAQVLDLGVKVASAIELAHGGGIVHRDIKPDNILFTDQREPKVSDWGLARHSLFSTFTAGYAATPWYCAPEQVAVQSYGQYGHPGDVFLLGLVLYEAATGTHPFVSPGEEIYSLPFVAIPNRIADQDYTVIPPTSRNPELPEALDDVILRALRRNPPERYREVYLIREELEKLLGHL